VGIASIAAILTLCELLFLAACRTPPPPARSLTLRLATGAPGGGFQPLGDALADAFRRAVPDLDIIIKPSAGAVSNVDAIQDSQADMGLAFADVAYIASIGQLEHRHTPFSKLRAIAVLQLTPVHLVVGARSGIQRLSDLQGKRVGVGPPGSGTALTASLLFKAYGVELDSVQRESFGFDEAAARVIDGTLDAMFDNGTFPVGSVRKATEAGAHLIAIEGPATDRLRREYPFLRLTSIPRGTYPRQSEPIHTIGVDSLLVCNSDLDEGLVYMLTQRLFDALPAASARVASLRFMDLEQAAAAPIPLHEGAARYYREREFTR
jgi:TRAP transporter TAXI family solute receptor